MKAYLVKFTATTRIVVDDDREPVDELFYKISDAAADKIIKNGVRNYINAENAEVTEDVECPAGTFDLDKEESIK